MPDPNEQLLVYQTGPQAPQALAVRRQSHLASEERHKLASVQYRPPLPPSSIVRLISLFPPSIKPPLPPPE